MRCLLVILLLPVSALAIGGFGIGLDTTTPFELLNNGLGGAAAFGDANQILVGTTAADGSFAAQSVSPNNYFSSIVFGIDPNSFSVIGNTLYSKGLANGGSYPSMVTNYTSAVFASTNRFILGTVPSFFGYSLSGADYQTYLPDTIPTFPSYPTILVSADGGSTWSGNFTNVPCIVELTNSIRANDNCSNLVIYSYVNPAQYNATNDYTTATIFVNTAGDNRSPVPKSQAQTIAASAAATAVSGWSQSPAVSSVNLAGKPLVFNGTWSVTQSNQTMIWQANYQNVMTLTPGVTAGGQSIIEQLTIAGTTLTFQVAASSVPTMQYAFSLPATNWTTLPSQTNWQGGGYWYVSAPAVTNGSCFFRASTAGTNSTAANMTINAKLLSTFIFTNAAGAKFSLTVNSSTNGFIFTPQ